MTSNDDDTIEPKSEAANETPADEPASTPPESASPSLPRAEPPFGKLERHAQSQASGGDKPDTARKAPQLMLMPWPAAPKAEAAAAAAKPAKTWRIDPLSAAASLAAVGFVAVSLFAAYDHVSERALVAGKTEEAQELVKSVAALKTRMEAIETTRSQEQTVEFKKTLADIKAAAATAQGANSSLVQLTQRVDKMDKEQNARLDKLNERQDQTSANTRLTEIVARLDKLEKRPITVAAVQTAPQPSPSTKATPSPSPGVSNDITGSIDRPKPILRGFTLDDVRAGVAYIESRDGPFTVSAGDMVPGAGRVLRIERRGPNYVVVTSQGIITTPEAPY